MNELMINLRAEQKVPLYEQIYDYIKDDIKKGRIQSGEDKENSGHLPCGL